MVNYVIRNAPRPSGREDIANAYVTPSGAPPAARVHVDMSRSSAWSTMKAHAGSDVTQAWAKTGKHFMFFSLWRPLATVMKDPIALIDARTVRPADLVRMRRFFPDAVSKGQNEIVLSQAAASPSDECRHQWYWMSRQTPEDLLIIKLYDSKTDMWEEDHNAPVPCAPHSSFEISCDGEVEGRKSIEIRIGVVFE